MVFDIALSGVYLNEETPFRVRVNSKIRNYYWRLRDVGRTLRGFADGVCYP